MPLKILKASAGSGKTFQLTRHYLELCLRRKNPLYFQHILAITFTNKATQEMKEKIMAACQELANNSDQSAHLEYFKDKLQLSEEEISNRATRILESIIYNYGRFSISTIDSFFQRVLRAFKREVHIDDAYEIRLDAGRVLSEAIDIMVDDLNEGHEAIEGIQSMIDHRIEENKSWRFDEDLVTFGYEIFKEGLVGQEEIDVENLMKVKIALRKQLKTWEKNLDDFRVALNQGLEKLNVSSFEFAGKGRSFMVSTLNDRKSIADLAELKSLKTAANAVVATDGWVSKSESPGHKEKIESTLSTLLPIIHEIWTFTSETQYAYNSTKSALKNFDSFVLLSAIQNAVKEYTKSENIFVLANTQPLLQDVISREQAPFLYEKIGTRYFHYLIDEFQDTSKLQYYNLKPLLEEALASTQNGDSLLVGDTKQAIYRWRSGEWEILENEVPTDFVNNEKELLGENFRSYEEVISFNNGMYQKAANYLDQVVEQKILDDEDDVLGYLSTALNQIYEGVSQNLGISSKRGGYAEICQINALKGERFYVKEYQAFQLELLKERLEGLYEMSYGGNEICVLYRRNKEGDILAEHLNRWESDSKKGIFKFQSDESLYLKNSKSVIATLSFLNLLFDAENLVARLNLWKELEQLEIASNVAYDLIAHDSFFEKVCPTVTPLFEQEETSDILQMTQAFWEATGLNMNSSERVFLAALQDDIIDFVRSKGNDMAGYLEHFFDVANELKVKGDSADQGIKLMSIHQSKGLEFDIVFIPFGNWDMSMKGNIWVEGDVLPIPINHKIPLSVKGGAALEKSNFRGVYLQEWTRNLIDHLNLLYVATTRAVKQLYIFTQAQGKLKSGEKVKPPSKISDIISASVTFPDLQVDDRFSIYRHGVLERNLKTEDSPHTNTLDIGFFLRKELPNIKEGEHPEALELESSKGEERSQMSIGFIIHHLLEHINDEGDVDRAIERSIQDGILFNDEKEYFKKLVLQILGDEQMKPWFGRTFQQIIERDVLMPDGKIYRPDRVSVQNDQTWILDFKSGQESKKNNKQVYNYIRILEKMKYPKVRGFIYYTKDLKLVEI